MATELDEAWLTYTDGNPNYQGAASVLLRSLAEFSTRPVFVYGVRADFPAQGHTNIAGVFRNDGPDHVWTQKMLAMITASAHARRLIFVDADTVANYDVDALWGQFGRERVPGIPLLQEHTTLHGNPDANRFTVLTGEVIDRPFGCTSLIWFGADCTAALQEAADLRRRLEFLSPGVGDSECINAVLARRRFLENTPLCGPYVGWLANYLQQSPLSQSDMGDVREVYYHAFHGAKSPAEAERVFGALRTHRLPTHYRLPAVSDDAQ